MALLAVLAEGYPDIAAILTGSEELRVIIYSDEVTPGQQILGNDRKCQNIYWTLKNFGNHRLASEDLWFTVASLRTSECRKLEGGMSQVYKQVLKLFFGDPLATTFVRGLCFAPMAWPGSSWECSRPCYKMNALVRRPCFAKGPVGSSCVASVRPHAVTGL